MALFEDLGEGVRKVFLAGVGAVALSAEMSAELMGELVKKGEMTVDQGMSLNEELTRKAKESLDNTHDAFLKAHLQTLTGEERKAYAERVVTLVDEINQEEEAADTVEAEAEEVAEAEAQEPVEAAEEAAPTEGAAEESESQE